MAMMPPGMVGPNPIGQIGPPGQTPPSPADLARQRDNKKRDIRRQEGAAALDVLKSNPQIASGTPTVPGAAGTVPQPTGWTPPAAAPALPERQPIPAAPEMGRPIDPTTGQPLAVPELHPAQYTPPNYNAAQYEAPKKGLQYLALAAGMLFPGSPLAHMASGFTQGMNQGAQQNYERKQQQAEQQFKVDQNAAQAKFQNENAIKQAEFQHENALFSAGTEEAKRIFLNKQAAQGVDIENATRTWQNGVDAATDARQKHALGQDAQGNPWTLPPELARPLPANATNLQRAQRAAGQASFFSKYGGTAAAAAAEQQASMYNTAWQHEQQITTRLRVASAQIEAANARAVASMQNSWNIHTDTQSQENARTDFRERRLDARELREKYKVASDLNAAGQRDYVQFQALRDKASKPTYLTNPDGTPVLNNGERVIKMPAALSSPDARAAFVDTLKKIGKEKDPFGAATYYAEQLPEELQTVRQALTLYGSALDKRYRATGRDIPSFQPPPPPKLSIPGLDMKNPKVMSLLQEASDAGLKLTDPDVIARIKEKAGIPGGPAAVNAPVDARHPDAPIFNALRGLGNIPQTSTAGQIDSQARAAGLTPGTPAWNNYMRSHAAR